METLTPQSFQFKIYINEFNLTFFQTHHDVSDVGGAGCVDGGGRVVLEALADGLTFLGHSSPTNKLNTLIKLRN